MNFCVLIGEYPVNYVIRVCNTTITAALKTVCCPMLTYLTSPTSTARSGPNMQLFVHIECVCQAARWDGDTCAPVSNRGAPLS
jgi:hypothetical protein